MPSSGFEPETYPIQFSTSLNNNSNINIPEFISMVDSILNSIKHNPTATVGDIHTRSIHIARDRPIKLDIDFNNKYHLISIP
ncbi:hypothetical protein Pmar_PMAR001553 [Perkinsus marinus ATCC 50983]|uniref:Uncharacterized protein n=1 Tax=Perkinsus marinus (strain ATCC 50983 / TXsc) TaxID=423536 RepID=C5KIZ8_PERM5|nr:hypothetical protein Pmar_PMAR001553 [Perkinsus marinus ATCC 50983]EER15545.1 hypothetical protein Pmar_PMAR001553 [Perkinsus marinus ATCC 50983]|eukprot:XP_002783749.1 hypothetical protein Pmar_PMAR001553 [Perkinsus marinus ATCC 50983]